MVSNEGTQTLEGGIMAPRNHRLNANATSQDIADQISHLVTDGQLVAAYGLTPKQIKAKLATKFGTAVEDRVFEEGLRLSIANNVLVTVTTRNGDKYKPAKKERSPVGFQMPEVDSTPSLPEPEKLSMSVMTAFGEIGPWLANGTLVKQRLTRDQFARGIFRHVRARVMPRHEKVIKICEKCRLAKVTYDADGQISTIRFSQSALPSLKDHGLIPDEIESVAFLEFSQEVAFSTSQPTASHKPDVNEQAKLGSLIEPGVPAAGRAARAVENQEGGNQRPEVPPTGSNADEVVVEEMTVSPVHSEPIDISALIDADGLEKLGNLRNSTTKLLVLRQLTPFVRECGLFARSDWNAQPSHRDRIAFVRLLAELRTVGLSKCQGKRRGVKHRFLPHAEQVLVALGYIEPRADAPPVHAETPVQHDDPTPEPDDSAARDEVVEPEQVDDPAPHETTADEIAAADPQKQSDEDEVTPGPTPTDEAAPQEEPSADEPIGSTEAADVVDVSQPPDDGGAEDAVGQSDAQTGDAPAEEAPDPDPVPETAASEEPELDTPAQVDDPAPTGPVPVPDPTRSGSATVADASPSVARRLNEVWTPEHTRELETRMRDSARGVPHVPDGVNVWNVHLVGGGFVLLVATPEMMGVKLGQGIRDGWVVTNIELVGLTGMNN